MTSHRVPIALALGAVLALPVAGVAAAAPGGVSAAQLDATQQIAQAALRKVAVLEASLDGRPAPASARSGKGGAVRATAAQLRTNQRIAQAAIRRAAGLEARLAGNPAPTTRRGRRDVIRLTAKQAAITRKIAVAAMRRANGLAKRIPYQHPTVEIEVRGPVRVRSAHLHDLGHAAVGMAVGGRPAVAHRRGPLGRWTMTALASQRGDPSVRFGPIVRVNAHGAALAVWSTSAGRFLAARREPGGRWSAGAPIGFESLSALALADDGTARVVGDGAQVLTQSGPGAPWLSPRAPSLVGSPVALNRRGGAVAAWKVDGPGPAATRSSEIVVSTLGSDGWGAPELVARTEAGVVAEKIAIALGDGGDATVVWGLYRDAAPLEGGLQGASRPAGASWGAPVELRPRGTLVFDLSVAVGDTGATIVAWKELGQPRAVAAFRPPGAAAFGSPAVLLAVGADDSAQNVEATVHPTGDGPTVLLRTEGHGGTVDWAVADPDGDLVWAPGWGSSTDEAAAVAAGGAILVAGPDGDDQQTLRIESRGTD